MAVAAVAAVAAAAIALSFPLRRRRPRRRRDSELLPLIEWTVLGGHLSKARVCTDHYLQHSYPASQSLNGSLETDTEWRCFSPDCLSGRALLDRQELCMCVCVGSEALAN